MDEQQRVDPASEPSDPAPGPTDGVPAALPLPFLQNGVAQIAFVVKDLDRTVEAYWKVFGIGPWHCAKDAA